MASPSHGTTAAAIPALGRLKGLKHLYLGGTKVTPEGFKTLQKLMPGCEVEMD